MDEGRDEDDIPTPTGNPGPPPSTPLTPKPGSHAASVSYPFLHATREPITPSASTSSASTSVLTSTTVNTDATSSTTDPGGDSLQLLSDLRFKFQRTEQELYLELSQTSERNLNDARRAFVTAARGATRRLSAWEKKHLSPPVYKSLAGDRHGVPEPEWWQSGCHAVPGGNVIVRENDWGSIIAFTLRWVICLRRT